MTVIYSGVYLWDPVNLTRVKRLKDFGIYSSSFVIQIFFVTM